MSLLFVKKTQNNIYRILANKPVIALESIWIIVFVSFYYRLEIGTGSYMFLSIGTLIPFAMMIFGLANIEFGKVVANKVTFYLSSVSYCFFLSQLFMPELGKQVFKYISCPNLVKIFILFLICTVISITMHELIEKPIRRLLKRFNNTKTVI